MSQTRASSGLYDYDLLVIGGGTGGLAVAKEAASFGKRVLVLDCVAPTPQGTWGLGGARGSVGSVARKLLHQASLLGTSIQDARKYGWLLEEKVCHGWAGLVQGIQQQQSSLTSDLRRALEHDVTFLDARGHILGPHTVQATDIRGRKSSHTAEALVVATGDRPRYPDVPGDREHCITCDDLFSLPLPPGRTLIVGGASEGLEFAGFLSGLGSEVTVMVRSGLLKGFDHKMALKIENHMLVHGVKFLHGYTMTKVEEVEPGRPGRVRVTCVSADGRETLQEEFNTVLLAIGRQGCTEDLGLESIGVSTNQDTGRIQVNEEEQCIVGQEEELCIVGHVYAVGAVQDGRPRATPLSMLAGKLLAHRLYAGHNTKCDYTNVPTVLFTPMEYACCGLTEEGATELYGEADVEVYHSHTWPVEWTLPARDKNSCYAKVICHTPDQQRVVGVHVMGPSAGEVIQGFAVALRCRLTKQQLDDTVGVHPVWAQVLTTLTVTQRTTEAMMLRGNC